MKFLAALKLCAVRTARILVGYYVNFNTSQVFDFGFGVFEFNITILDIDFVYSTSFTDCNSL